ncbi:MAG TPA: SDR family oxidoreductase [Actinophytocola sp.]|uniref:SDR family NAD(P)-dependent oxidoreductase n=1 Tax=Actinophytocola sp. TaxID=1872138 RepID=UPI002DDC97AE|nr:SDR family oxidoreductase [Actinophytocola sp.]HEV2778122.1 SDR family oxidoreductase [Actinophytocola sp.]
MARTAVVTGGGGGIGKAIAAAFAADEHQVYITGRRADVLNATADALGPRVTAVVCDATDPDQVALLRNKVDGPVDILVNNAGSAPAFLGLRTDDLHAVAAHWRADFDANVLGAVLTTSALEEQLAGGGAVVHIGSFATDRGQGAYGAAKAALAAWNLHLAKKLGPRDITSNVVSPGYIAETEFFGEGMPPAFYEQRVAETLVGRPGRPEDIAGLVRFLTTPAARYITGQNLHVNGGALTTR